MFVFLFICAAGTVFAAYMYWLECNEGKTKSTREQAISEEETKSVRPQATNAWEQATSVRRLGVAQDIDTIQQFKDQSTWKLLFLSYITLGIYAAHYIKKQTVKINQIVKEEVRISDGFVNSILAIAYISLILFFAYTFMAFDTAEVDDGNPVVDIINVFNLVWGIMILMSAFKARNRINSAYELIPGDRKWFQGFWTFLFPVLYFNYKINCICEDIVNGVTPTDWTTGR